MRGAKSADCTGRAAARAPQRGVDPKLPRPVTDLRARLGYSGCTREPSPHEPIRSSHRQQHAERHSTRMALAAEHAPTRLRPLSAHGLQRRYRRAPKPEKGRLLGQKGPSPSGPVVHKLHWRPAGERFDIHVLEAARERIGRERRRDEAHAGKSSAELVELLAAHARWRAGAPRSKRQRVPHEKSFAAKRARARGRPARRFICDLIRLVAIGASRPRGLDQSLGGRAVWLYSAQLYY